MILPVRHMSVCSGVRAGEITGSHGQRPRKPAVLTVLLRQHTASPVLSTTETGMFCSTATPSLNMAAFGVARRRRSSQDKRAIIGSENPQDAVPRRGRRSLPIRRYGWVAGFCVRWRCRIAGSVWPRETDAVYPLPSWVRRVPNTAVHGAARRARSRRRSVRAGPGSPVIRWACRCRTKGGRSTRPGARGG